MSKEGCQLNARYINSAVKHHLCGQPGDSDIIHRCLTAGNWQDFIPIIKHFPDLDSHLHLIADKTGLDPNSYEVAQAYWRGNNLLAGFSAPPTHLSVVFSQNHPTPDLFLYQGINACMVTAGPIVEINSSRHIIKAKLLALSESKQYYRRCDITYDPDFFPELKSGLIVTSHLGRVAEIIDQPQFEQLEHWTDIVYRNLTSAKPVLPSPSL